MSDVLTQPYRVASIGGNAWVYRNDGGYCEERKVFFGGWGTANECEQIATVLSKNFGPQALFILDQINARAASILMNGGSKFDAAKAAADRAVELTA